MVCDLFRFKGHVASLIRVFKLGRGSIAYAMVYSWLDLVLLWLKVLYFRLGLGGVMEWSATVYLWFDLALLFG